MGEAPQQILEAIVDRGITRLVVEDGVSGAPAFEDETLASVRARVVTCLAYSASGRVADGDVQIAGNAVVEGYVEEVLEQLQTGGVPPSARAAARLRPTAGSSSTKRCTCFAV